jgi:hypothetical protein
MRVVVAGVEPIQLQRQQVVVAMAVEQELLALLLP